MNAGTTKFRSDSRRASSSEAKSPYLSGCRELDEENTVRGLEAAMALKARLGRSPTIAELVDNSPHLGSNRAQGPSNRQT